MPNSDDQIVELVAAVREAVGASARAERRLRWFLLTQGMLGVVLFVVVAYVVHLVSDFHGILFGARGQTVDAVDERGLIGWLVEPQSGIQQLRRTRSLGQLIASPQDRFLNDVDEDLERMERDVTATPLVVSSDTGSNALDFIQQYNIFILEVVRSRRMLRRFPNIVAIRNQMLKASTLPAEKQSKALRRLGDMLADLFLNLRGVWPKVAQIISMRPDVVRWEEIRIALAKSHDSCAPKADEQVLAILENSLPSWEKRVRLGPRLGTGSIGQVHLLLPREHGDLPEDSELVAKISFHGEHWKMKEDFRIMQALGQNTGRDEVSQLFRSIWLYISNSIKQIEGEFDMTREALFTSTGAKLVADVQDEIRGHVSSTFQVDLANVPVLSVPEVVDGSSNEVLILGKVTGTPLLTYIDGLPATDRGEAQLRIYGTIFMWLGYMIFTAGFYHGDPHPGQFLYEPATQRLALLDWGLSQQLSAQQRRDVHELYDLLSFQYDRSALEPRILRIAPAVVEYLGGRMAMESMIEWAVSEMDAAYRHRLATVMRRMGFESKGNSDLSLAAGAFGFFDTNIAYNDVEKLNRWQSVDPLISIPGNYLILMRIVSTIAGFSRRLAAENNIDSKRLAELSNVRLWKRFVSPTARLKIPPALVELDI